MNQPAPTTGPMLEVTDLTVTFQLKERTVEAVRGASLVLGEGEAIGILGESGSGKSVTGRALMGLLPKTARVEADTMAFRGRSLLSGDVASHGAQPMAMIFQSPFTALNPVFSIRAQLCEVLEKRRGMTRSAAAVEAVRLLDAVRIPDAKNRMNNYPHEFSGGQLQRIMIALALALEPEILIADEPTTALDVTVQAQVLELIREIRRERNMGLIFISHDLDVVSEVADRVYVMYAGRLIESGPVADMFDEPRHPYTRGLLTAAPSLSLDGGRLQSIPGSPPESGMPVHPCAFAPRCDLSTEICVTVRPELLPVGQGRMAACHHSEQLALRVAS